MSNPAQGVLGQNSLITPTNPQTQTKTKYSFVCWRCGANRHLITYHGPGGLLRICLSCAVKVGLQ